MVGMLKSILSEYGAGWAVNRTLYSAKLKTLNAAPTVERLFEKKVTYPSRLDIFRIDIDDLKCFLNNLGDVDKKQLIATADKACNGIIKGFSSIELDYGYPIDWQLNPMTGKRCDEKKKWYRIPDFDQQRGDIKVIWEASRFSHFITFARAYLLTGEEKYYKAYSEQLKSWLSNNTYGYGANYKCGQECSFRMVNTLLVFTVFKECGLITDADVSNVKDLLDRCYRKVLSNFFYAYKCIKNNHTISELMGMIIGAWCCKDDEKLREAFSLLDEVIDEQFTSDGGYTQFSFNYERLALQDLECVLSVEECTGCKLQNRDKIKKAALLMYQCQDESGDMPNYGSNDGALIFPVTSCGYRDFRPIINTIYALTAGRQLYAEGKHQEEMIWFGVRNCLKEDVERQSSAFSDAGLFTIRNKESWMMIVLNDFQSRPAHLDQFHLDLWIGGENVLCDAGSYSYASDVGKDLVKTSSHNTVKAAGNEQMKQRGPFLIYNWTKREINTTNSNTFEGTMISSYVHDRKVEYSEGDYIITDRVDGDYEVLFHTPYEVTIFEKRVLISKNSIKLCELISNGDIEISRGTRSLYYFQKEEINCISIKGRKDHSTKTIIKVEGETK